jgi:hypothetical protein
VRSHAKALFAVTALFMLFGASQAQASKTVNSFFGSPPGSSSSLGGQFNTPRGVAVNVAGTGGASAGDIYVVDSSNNRVQQFSAAGAFIRAFGQDVIVNTGTPANSNGTGFEICDTTAGNVAADCKAGINSAATGGAMSSPQGIAINQASGHLYVSDSNFRRVDEFDATGHFVRAFGQDVVASGPGNNPAAAAKQTLKVEATAGQFKLTFRGQTSADIEFNASAATVQTALQALSTVGAANATVSGGPGNEGGTTPYVITFAGALNNAPMPLISSTSGTTPLSGGAASASVANTTTGSSGFEVCSAPADTCQSGASGSTAGAFASTFNGHLAIAPVGAPNAANVLVADPGNRRVQEFTSAGAFVRAFGFDVTSSPPNSTTTFETCDASNLDVCKAGVAGSGSGQFGSSSPSRVAVDSTGAIYTVEQSSNFRVQKFTPAGPTLTPALFNPQVSAAPAVNLSGTSSENAPTDVAIGASDRVFVTKVCTAVNCPGAALATERRIYEFSAAGVLQDTHIANAAINAANGLAANAANGRLYVSSLSFGSPFRGAQRVYVLTDALAPTATIAAADNLNATGATLHGEVNPGGVLGSYHFEYVDDPSFQATGWADAQTGPDIEAGNAPTAVSREVEGLAASTLYHARLVAKHSFGTQSATSAETTFTTAAAKPIVAPFASADATTTSATLSSRVTANGQATSYHFEWGMTTAYGNSTPATAIGAGIASVFAAAQISGLSPATTYHYRLVATSPSGTSAGADHAFMTEAPIPPAPCPNAALRQGVGAELPDCRAYEQVSPTDKNGADVQSIGAFDLSPADTMVEEAGGPAAPDGSRVAFQSPGSFAGSTFGGSSRLYYLSRRDGDGWGTAAIFPRVDPAFRPYSVLAFSPDMSEALLNTGSGATLTADPPGETNFYLRDSATGAIDFLGRTLQPASLFVGSNLTHIAFSTLGPETAESGQPPAGTRRVYELAGGQLRLVSRRPGDDAPFQTEMTGISISGGISADGRHIFFAPQFANDVYRRSDGTTTVLASPSKRTPADPLGAKEKKFKMATPDGNRVFFTSAELLTDDANTGPARAGADLYRYDFEADRLIDISATLGGDGARVQGLVGTSAAGDRVYYVALGQVLPGQGVAGQPNLYLWEDDGTAAGRTRFIGTLDPTSNPNPTRGDDESIWLGRFAEARARVSADGAHLAFLSRAPLTGYDNHQAPGSASCDAAGPAIPGERCAQVYLYDAGAGVAGDLRCLSCDLAGTPIGPALVTTPEDGLGSDPPRFLSEDGHRVFFTSPDPLLARDTNGRLDAYEWEAEGAGSCEQAGGCLSLLSSGTGNDDSFFHAASADGSDAFFRTRDQLVPQDGDTLADLYTAHVGGGFLSQQELPPPSCAGEECRGAGSQPPTGQGPLTSSFAGPGNAKPEAKARCPKGKRQVKARNGKSRCVKQHKRHNRKRAAKTTGRASR